MLARYRERMTHPESHWTPPSDWCPHPERWTSDTADATEHEVSHLIGGLVTALQPDLVVETGCNTGQTSQAIGQALKANGHGRLLTCDIDPTMTAATTERCRGLPVLAYLMPARNLNVTEPIGLLFLDSHAHERHLEMDYFRPRLAPGALIVVHDTAPHHPVDTYLRTSLRPGDQMLRLRTPRGVSVIQCG